MELILGPQEQKLLLEILESYLGDLREEVYKTETFRFKEDLKARETLLRSLIEKIQKLPAETLI
ncbi:MAG TPA: hypothetical protein VJM80_02860 [bacterium]|nr:hypothetical protein [bacterium]